MKKIVVALVTLALCASTLSAAAVDVAALRMYAKNALSRCPDAMVTIEQIQQPGPMNFFVFEVDIKAKDENCNTRKYLFYSPSTQQVVLGTVFTIPEDDRPLNVRISAQSTEMLKQPVTASVSGFPLPDGLKNVAITKQTPYGPFSYHGYVDASQRFMMVGMRGTLRTPPNTTLREALAAGTAVRRGNPKAKL